MDKKILLGIFVILGFSVLIVLLQLEIFDESPKPVCSPPAGSLNGLDWSEMFVDTNGGFYVKIINIHNFPITVTNINIEPRRPSNITYTIKTPLPLEVRGKEEFLIVGEYNSVNEVSTGDECWFYVDITFTDVMVRDVLEHEASGSISGRCGIVRVPTCE